MDDACMNVGAEPSLAADNPISKPLLVCFSHLRWNFVWQRPQHLLSRAAQSYRVIFFEEPIYEAPDSSPRLDRQKQSCGVTIAVPHVPGGGPHEDVVQAQRAMLDGLLAGEAGGSVTFWYYTPMALAFSAHVRPDACVYDCMDELSAFRFAPPELVDFERDLFSRADLVFTGGRSLYEAKRGRHAALHAFPSSIDKAHFGTARKKLAEPRDQAGIARPRLGFFGVIDERMDLGLLARLAELKPDWQFVMIGPVAKIDEAELPRSPNIHWLGQKGYAELPAYLAGWDVAIMPFALNESTRFISPTKTPEFLAAGVPVVSTPITDVVSPWGDAGLVEIAGDAEGFAAKAERLMRRKSRSWLAKVDARLAGMSWDATWDSMHALLRRAGTPGATAPSRVRSVRQETANA